MGWIVFFFDVADIFLAHFSRHQSGAVDNSVLQIGSVVGINRQPWKL